MAFGVPYRHSNIQAWKTYARANGIANALSHCQANKHADLQIWCTNSVPLGKAHSSTFCRSYRVTNILAR
jgi:hypothetical protein